MNSDEKVENEKSIKIQKNNKKSDLYTQVKLNIPLDLSQLNKSQKANQLYNGNHYDTSSSDADNDDFFSVRGDMSFDANSIFKHKAFGNKSFRKSEKLDYNM